MGSLAPGQSQTVTVSFVVPTSPTIVTPCPTVCVEVSPRLTNMAQLVVDGTFGVITTTTNTIVNPRLTVTKTLIEPALGASQIVPGGSTVGYRIVVENADTETARDVRLTDHSPRLIFRRTSVSHASASCRVSKVLGALCMRVSGPV